MKSDSFNICLAIPIKSDNYRDIELTIKEGIKSGSNFIEFRFDYIKNEELIKGEFLRNLKKLIPAKVSSIFTLRHHSEGGKLKIDDFKREAIIQKFIKAQPNFIDIEMNSSTDLLKKIKDISDNTETRYIFSYHNFAETPDLECSKSIIEKFKHFLLDELSYNHNTINNSVYKLIFTAQEFQDNFIPIKLCSLYSKLNRNIISFCMGDLGIFSRIFTLKGGAFLTYGSSTEKTAPGQISIKVIKECLDLEI